MKLNFSNIFRNELLAKVNQLKRNGVFESGPWSFNCFSSSDNISGILLSCKYYLACVANLIVLIVSKRTNGKEVFFFVNKRNLSFNNWNYAPFKIGLFNFRYFEYPHIYSVLTNLEIMRCIFESLLQAKVFKNELSGLAASVGVADKIVFSVLGNSYFRVLDCLLAERAIIKIQKVSTSGHFDIYTAISSELRRDGLIELYLGNQHGLYEHFSQADPYKMTFDKYCLMFRDSEPYVLDKLLYQDDLEILHAPKNNLELKICDHGHEAEKIIAFGFQNDNFARDVRILELFSEFFSSSKYILVVYLHPQASPSHVGQLAIKFPFVRFELKKRFSNIDLLITRYSTIGINYALVGVNAIFILGEENICISQSSRKEIKVVYSDEDAIVEATRCLAKGGGDEEAKINRI
jgi:hypothetical protein